MGIFKPLVGNIDLAAKHKEIVDDILNNAEEIRYRTEYYTRKYRGNRLNDINVGIYSNGGHQYVVQVFLRNKQGWVKDTMTFDYKGNLIESIFKLKENE